MQQAGDYNLVDIRPMRILPTLGNVVAEIVQEARNQTREAMEGMG